MAIVDPLVVGLAPAGLELPTVTPGILYDIDANALFARMTVQPDDTRKALISRTIVSLKTAGVWSKFGALYFIAAHDAQAARLNWISSSYELGTINAPAFVTDRGYTGDGTSSYLSTGYAYFTDPINSTNDGIFGGYLNGGPTAASVNVLGGTVPGGSNPRTVIRARSATDTIQGTINTLGTTALANVATVTTPLGMTSLVRRDAANISAHRNGALVGTVAEASLNEPAQLIALLAFTTGSNPSGFSNNQIAHAFMGAGLSDTEITAHYNAVQTYLTAMGAQV